MKIVQKIILVLMVLLSLAAGAAKVMQVPTEVEFFKNLGLSTNVLMGFGIAQIIAAIELAIPVTRKFGIPFVALMFLASAVMLFMSGNVPFGAISLIPVVLTLFLFKKFD